MAEFILYGESTWQSPWVFHVMVALEELRVRYRLEIVPLPIPPGQRAELERRAVIGKVPVLVERAVSTFAGVGGPGEVPTMGEDVAISESLAISEYLAERCPPPDHPALLPIALADRARARQVMSFLRTSLLALREARPTSSVFQHPVQTPLDGAAKRDAAELVRVAEAVVPAGATCMFGAWSIADSDLALALMRLVANGDPVPQRLADYAAAQWGRSSVRRYLSYVPTSR
jgi:glutathione S-transferase